MSEEKTQTGKGVDRMSRNIHNERTDRLLDGILSLQNREEAYRFFEDLCTVNELESLGQRFEVAGMR